jgi:hypothetical protein
MGMMDSMRSDDLVWLSELFDSLGELNAAVRAAFGSLIRVRAVLDTNLVLGDLKSLVVERQNPAARTAAQEAIASRTVIAYAPEFLRHEVEKNLPALAEQTNRPLEEFEREWSSYQKPIRFVPVSVTDVVAESSSRVIRSTSN